MSHKKAFQSNANYLLAKSPCFIVNKLEDVRGRVGGGQTTDRRKGGPVERTDPGSLCRKAPPLWTDRQTDTTENITFPQLRWRALKMMDAVQISRFSVSHNNF